MGAPDGTPRRRILPSSLFVSKVDREYTKGQSKAESAGLCTA